MSMGSGKVRATLIATALLLWRTAAWCEDAGPERFNAFGQLTYIRQLKEPFAAVYTNANGSPNSLLPERERSYSATATAFLGLRAWPGAELYLVPELISEQPLSDLHGLGGSIQNAELEKNGKRSPTLYRSRLFLRQTWDLEGESSTVKSGPMQLAGPVAARRVVLTAGNLAVIDVFDKNAYAGDARQQFLNMDFLTHAAFDFAADARGYSWGLAAEYYHDAWALRFGRFLVSKDPNELPLDTRLFQYHGDQVEVEHAHRLFGQPGKLRLLAYRNVENMARWDDAIGAFEADPARNAAACTTFNYGSANAAAPDLCWARKSNVKVGLGLNVEQALAQDAGVFLRAMQSDGRTEVYSYTATDSSVSLGALIRGERWARAQDTLGIGYAQNWLSSAHVAYLALGGVDAFIGDGRIRYRPEKTAECFYNANLSRHLWLTLDLQHIVDPAYNADRGPVSIYGIRVHAEI